MHFFGRNFILNLLLSSLFISCVQNKPLSNKQLIGYTVATAAGVAILTGGYLLFFRDNNDDDLDNFEVVDKNGEKILQKKSKSGTNVKKTISNVLKFMILPSAAGLGAYWVLKDKTSDGYLKIGQEKTGKAFLGLGEKFSDGWCNLVEHNFSVEDLLKLVNANFGKDTNCPFVEAVKYLRTQQESLQEAKKIVETLEAAEKNERNEVEIVNLRTQIQKISDKISSTIDIIIKSEKYPEELKRYDSLDKERIARAEASLQRKYDLGKWIIMSWGASKVAGTLVSPFI